MTNGLQLAHSITWSKAAKLNLTTMGVRSLPGKRDGYAQLARDLVALSIRMDRFTERRLRK